jgi:hypothetical protein
MMMTPESNPVAGSTEVRWQVSIFDLRGSRGGAGQGRAQEHGLATDDAARVASYAEW